MTFGKVAQRKPCPGPRPDARAFRKLQMCSQMVNCPWLLAKTLGLRGVPTLAKKIQLCRGYGDFWKSRTEKTLSGAAARRKGVQKVADVLSNSQLPLTSGENTGVAGCAHFSKENSALPRLRWLLEKSHRENPVRGRGQTQGRSESCRCALRWSIALDFWRKHWGCGVCPL